MKSLQDYFFEDEDKFVSIEYKTTTTDDVQLAGSVHQPETEEEELKDPDDRMPSGTNLSLVGELRLYSETSLVFNERKRVIAKKFKKILKDEELNANRVMKTKIFMYYIKHLIHEYIKSTDINVKVNISTKQELSRQLAADLVMLIRQQEIFPKQ